MCLTGNGRFGAAILNGDPLQMSWEAGHLMTTFAQVIPIGLRDAEPEKFELTQLIMAYLSFPEINNQISRYIQYSPHQPGILAASCRSGIRRSAAVPAHLTR